MSLGLQRSGNLRQITAPCFNASRVISRITDSVNEFALLKRVTFCGGSCHLALSRTAQMTPKTLNFAGPEGFQSKPYAHRGMTVASTADRELLTANFVSDEADIQVILFLVCIFLASGSPAIQASKNTRRGIENAGALTNFFKALGEAESKSRLEPVRIMHFGDSHVAADVLTREIRDRLQDEFGNGGAGFIVPRNPMSTRRRGVSSGFTEGWIVEGIGGRYSPDAIYGPAGINLRRTAHENARITGNHLRSILRDSRRWKD